MSNLELLSTSALQVIIIPYHSPSIILFHSKKMRTEIFTRKCNQNKKNLAIFKYNYNGWFLIFKRVIFESLNIKSFPSSHPLNNDVSFSNSFSERSGLLQIKL